MVTTVGLPGGVSLVHVRLICIWYTFEAHGATMAMDGSSMKFANRRPGLSHEPTSATDTVSLVQRSIRFAAVKVKGFYW